jgi:hypothetical protein
MHKLELLGRHRSLAAATVTLAAVFSASGSLAGASAAVLPPGCSQSGQIVTCTYTSGSDQFIVPTGVSSIHVVAVGGMGGAGFLLGPPGVPGGHGALVSGDLPVTASSTLYAVVGGNGCNSGAVCTSQSGQTSGGATGGAGGGGGLGGGGGGDASDVRASQSNLSSRLLVAAGGGGAGGYSFGPFGGVSTSAPGQPGGAGGGNGGGSNLEAGGGAGGTASSGGSGGAIQSSGLGTCLSGPSACVFGGGGTPGGLGSGGPGGGGGSIFLGTSLQTNGGGAGGGGGGLFGGGGGAGGTDGGGGGGGGGSNLVPTGGSQSIDTTGVPMVQISYNLVPTTKAQCKHGGWRNFGGMFKNHRQCVAFVVKQARRSCVAERAKIGRQAFRHKYGVGRRRRHALRRCIQLHGG